MPKGSKVLMADDDAMLLDMYKERLELAGYLVTTGTNGEELLAKLKEATPDIIMLDIMMPKLDGYETLASIKSDPTTKDIPVIMLSALMRDFNKEKAMEGGADDYLIKSEAMPSDVITKIEQVLVKYGKGGSPGASGTPTSPAPQVVFEPAQAEAMSENPPAGGEPEQVANHIETQPAVPATPPPPPETPVVESIGRATPVPEPEKKSISLWLWLGVFIVLLVGTVLVYFLLIKK